MPRRALSTLRAEIKEGGPSGTSMELSESASSEFVPSTQSASSAFVVSTEVSFELLIIQNLGGFEAKTTELLENIIEPYLGLGRGKLLWDEM